MTPIALRDHKRIQLYLDIIVKHKITGARWVRVRDKLSAVVDDNERMPRRRVMVMVMIVITMITMKLNMTRFEHRHLWLSASYFAVKARTLYRPRYLLQVYHNLGNSQHLPRSHPWKIIWLVVTGCNKVLYQCDLMIIWQSSLRSAPLHQAADCGDAADCCPSLSCQMEALLSLHPDMQALCDIITQDL